MIKVLKTNENIVRDAAEKKKNVMIYGLKGKVIPMTMVEDFNCSEVNWETFEGRGENTCGNTLLRLMMNK